MNDSSLCFLIFLAIFSLASCDKELKCLVCRSLVQEMNSAFRKVDPNKKINVGAGRLNVDGQIESNLVPFLKSSIHLNDLMENICNEFDDYVEGTFKDTHERAILKIMLDGKMNPDFGRLEPKLKDDLNKGLKFYCETIVEEFDDAIMKVFGQNSTSEDEEADFCMKEAGLCEFHEDEEPYEFEEKDEL